MEAALERQRASLEKQKVSVRRQVQSAVEDPFFIVPLPPAGGAAPERQPEPQPDCQPMSAMQTAPLIANSARTTGVPPSVIRAVIAQESAGYPCATSIAGAQGLMQLMPGTARYLGVTNPLDPEQNIEAGSRYLKELLDRYGGNLMLALAAYNAGPSRVDAYGGLPPITETGRYVDQVLRRVMGEKREQ